MSNMVHKPLSPYDIDAFKWGPDIKKVGKQRVLIDKGPSILLLEA